VAGEEAPPNLCHNPACGAANAPGERSCVRCGTPLPHPPGYVIHGLFRIRKLLDSGAIEHVYLAEDVSRGGLEVAVKEMICNDAQELALRLDFLRREADTLGSLKTASVLPRFHGLFESDRTACLAFEHLPGPTLAQLLARQGFRPFPLGQVIGWAELLADLLVEAHALSPPMIRWNFAPKHFLLAGGHLRMAWGPRPFEPAPADPPWRDVVRDFYDGMLGYVAPEESFGSGEPRSDLFTLACCLYELATGEVAQGDDSAARLHARLGSGCRDSPEERCFLRLLAANLSEDAGRRSGTTSQFRLALLRRPRP
jgi:serine/threonine protein kinase